MVDKIAPLDPETARSACALVLSALFASRTATKFGLAWKRGGFGLSLLLLHADLGGHVGVGEKIKTS